MTDWLFQCVPNVSEGTRMEVVERVAQAIRAVAGVSLLDYSADKDHNRSVFTFIGGSEPLREAVAAMYRVCCECIDLRQHHGAHPRVGAVDVVPFVPLEATPMEAAVNLSRLVAEDVVREFAIPVYYYEESALRPERRSLAYIRKGGFESLLESPVSAERRPDVGPAQVHERWGASCIGARGTLVAFNVLLDTPDVAVAKAVAKKVRERDGGLRFVRALGIFLKERGRAQVSLNLINPDKTSLYTAFEMVRMEARRFGVRVYSSELIGEVPLRVLADVAAYYLQLESLTEDRVLERGILNMVYKGQAESIAGPDPRPL